MARSTDLDCAHGAKRPTTLVGRPDLQFESNEGLSIVQPPSKETAMPRVIRIRSTFQMVIDLEDPASVKSNKDVIDYLVDEYNASVKEKIKSLTEADADELHDLIRKSIEEDVESVIDISDLTSENSFDIEVLS